MSVLSTVAMLLVLKAGGGPRTIDFIYTVGPYVNSTATYVACAAPGAGTVDYCVVGGAWVGLCSKKETPLALARVEGPLVFSNRLPRIEGCEENVRLMWKRQGSEAPAYQAPKAGVQKVGAQVSSVELTEGDRTYSLVLDQKTLRLEVKDAAGKKRALSLQKEFGDAVKQSTSAVLDFVGDVSGDGAPEAIVALSLDGYTRTFESKWNVPVAVMVSLSDPLRVVGFTSGSPFKLYSARHCAEVGCDVIAYLDDQASCAHFAGEEPYDEERRKFIEDAMQGCDKLEARRLALLKKYRDNARVKKALTPEASVD
ncbi:hypothetical protein JY651_43150 [Pyxidicoccus parkwayensis]|uniref:Lipoprotein n=1 Tax=Pyxidicoccus parkwayensis TaxID=2813578 RepID=A0ABX7P0P2_9BACT|nr:hypothetical protein [Pyxidicoccus parkwaysis]QSQ21878.1 hypothetical protein JY651_43150 [Pyxidicoccus parkwaysis]